MLGTTPPPIRQFQPTLAILFNTAHTAKNIVQTVCGSQKGIDRKWCSGEKRSSGCADGRLASGCGLQGLAAETVLAHTGRSWHIKSCLLEERCTAPTTDVTYELPLRQVRSPWLPQTTLGTLICQAARNKIGLSSSVLSMSVKQRRPMTTDKNRA